MVVSGDFLKYYQWKHATDVTEEGEEHTGSVSSNTCALQLWLRLRWLCDFRQLLNLDFKKKKGAIDSP